MDMPSVWAKRNIGKLQSEFDCVMKVLIGRDSSQAKKSVMCALCAIVPSHGSIDQISEDAHHRGDAKDNESDDCYERHAAP